MKTWHWLGVVAVCALLFSASIGAEEGGEAKTEAPAAGEGEKKTEAPAAGEGEKKAEEAPAGEAVTLTGRLSSGKAGSAANLRVKDDTDPKKAAYKNYSLWAEGETLKAVEDARKSGNDVEVQGVLAKDGVNIKVSAIEELPKKGKAAGKSGAKSPAKTK